MRLIDSVVFLVKITSSNLSAFIKFFTFSLASESRPAASIDKAWEPLPGFPLYFS